MFIILLYIFDYVIYNRGTEDIASPHGIPVDLLDRLLIIRTLPYTQDEIRTIIRIRSKTEGLQLLDEAVDYLSEVGVKSSLRYIYYKYICILIMLIKNINFFFFNF